MVVKKHPAIICDLDGTLALFHKNRGPYETWKCENDELNQPVYTVVMRMADEGFRLIICSGREEKYREETERWLAKHYIEPVKLFMRKAGDKRSDDIVKSEFLEEIQKKYDIHFVLDDRDRVVKMWRKNGLQCWQVAEGNFS